MLAHSFLLALAAATPAPAASIARVDHVAIQVADIDRSAAFYHEAFGLPIIATPSKNRRWLDLGNGVALHIHDERRGQKPSNRSEHLALRVDDLSTVSSWLDSHKVAWGNSAGQPRTIQTRFDGVRQIYLQDPDGNWIEVDDGRGTPTQ